MLLLLLLRCRFLLGLAAGLFCLASSASAIVIETGGAQVGGYRDWAKALKPGGGSQHPFWIGQAG